jgi:putative PIN family toxin of toxin-antitoxin system
MLDTNVLISALLFPKSIAGNLVVKILMDHKLVLCSFIIDELHNVIQRKFESKLDDLKTFLLELSYEMVYTPKKIDKSKYPDIRDEADVPILVSAIIADVDILISGDKDFLGVDIERPQIIVPADFMKM